MSRSSRRHSVSGDHHYHHRLHRYDHDRDSAYGSLETSSPRRRYQNEDRDVDPYEPRRAASHSTRGASRRHSPDRGTTTNYGDDRRGRRRHDDDYDPRDKYYLSGEEDLGWRSQSQPRYSKYDPRNGDDYFSSRHRQHGSVDAYGQHDRSRERDYSRSHRDREARADGHGSREDHRSRRRHDAPPMSRRKSSSAPPPESRSEYPPSSSYNRHGRSKYPPSTTETRKKGRSMSSSHAGGSGGGGGGGGGSRSRSNGRSGSSHGVGGPFGDIPWSAAARCALEAGTMAALKSYDQPGAWLGTKGAQIATAAVGAALVDGYIANKNPAIRGGKRHAVLRQVTNAALGSFVMNPAGKTVEKKQPMKQAGKHVGRHIPIARHHKH